MPGRPGSDLATGTGSYNGDPSGNGDHVLRRQATGLKARAGAIRHRLTGRVPAGARRRFDLAGLSLARRYLLLSLVFVVVGGGIVAYSLGQLIETSAINRTTSVTALYVESFVAPELQSLATSPSLSQPEIDSLRRLLNNSPLSQKVVSFRIWSTDGRILYSPVPELIGRQFDMGGERGLAVQGAVIGDISNLSDPENVYERQHWSHLIEIYLPVRVSGSSQIIAVAEFYQLPDDLEAEVNRDRLIAWALVAAATFLAYLALARVVRQGSETIVRQEGELRRQVAELSALLEQNARLHARVRQAASRTTALTELERRRIGSDLPRRPNPDARLRDAAAGGRWEPARHRGRRARTAAPTRTCGPSAGRSMSAMADIRTIAAGLRTPELEEADPADIVRRAVAEHERRSGTRPADEPRRDPAGRPARDEDRAVPHPVRSPVERRSPRRRERSRGGGDEDGRGRPGRPGERYGSGLRHVPRSGPRPPWACWHARARGAAGRLAGAGIRRPVPARASGRSFRLADRR